jgi:3-methyl-2-oxobutanoate hydroxymethyltransferase
LPQAIPRRLSLQTIGDGTGPGHAGHNLSVYGILGIFDRFVPKLVRRFCQVGQEITQVFDDWRKDVMEGRYPLAGHGLNVPGREIAGLHNTELSRN